MLRLVVGNKVDWLYPIGYPIKRIKVIARLLCRRHNVRYAELSPYCCVGDTIYIMR